MLNEPRIENGNVVIPEADRRTKEDLIVPLDFLETLSKYSSYKLEEALWFYRTTKNVDEWYWSKIEDLVGKDLRGYELHYWVPNYEDSAWESTYLLTSVQKREVASHNPLLPSPDSYTAAEESYTEGEDDGYYGYSFVEGERVLVTKTSADDYAEMLKDFHSTPDQLDS